MSALLTPELLAHIGKTAEPDRQLATRRDIRKYAIATGQRLRKFLDGDEAPPMFHVALFWPVVERPQIAPDGVAIDTFLPDFPLKRGMAGGLNIQYERPIRPGDWLTATRTLTDIYEKQGRSGPLIFYETVMVVTNDEGDVVLTETTTRILR